MTAVYVLICGLVAEAVGDELAKSMQNRGQREKEKPGRRQGERGMMFLCI